MFVAIRQYRINPRNVGEITQQVQTGFLPLLRSAPGLIEYNWIDAGNGRLVSVDFFKDRASAEASTELAANYVRQHLWELIRNPPDVVEGEVLIHEVLNEQARGA